MAKRERRRRAQYDFHPYTEREWIDERDIDFIRREIEK